MASSGGSAPTDPLEPKKKLTTPGGGHRGPLSGGGAVADDGTRFAIENGIVRMLGQVDPQLAAELAAQDAAKEIYLDEGFIVMRHEYELIRLLVGELLSGTAGRI